MLIKYYTELHNTITCHKILEHTALHISIWLTWVKNYGNFAPYEYMSSLNCSKEYRQYVEKCLVGENLVHEIEG